jgi:hypothetical protein
VLPGSPTPEEQAAYDAALAARNAAEDLAVSVLWALSGRQFGLCPHSVRPCPPPIYPPWREVSAYSPVTSYVLSWEGDRWLNWPCGCLGGRCQLTGPRAVHLPGPVASIEEVTIAGAVLNASEYVLEGDVLYRKGTLIWPAQNLGRPLGEAGTWSVEYLRGYPPPAGTATYVGTLAAEFLKACDGGNCRLPRTVTTASRNGVTYRVYDPAVIYGDGKTGIPEIDLWLAAVNPHHLMAAPQVI